MSETNDWMTEEVGETILTANWGLDVNALRTGDKDIDEYFQGRASMTEVVKAVEERLIQKYQEHVCDLLGIREVNKECGKDGE